MSVMDVRMSCRLVSSSRFLYPLKLEDVTVFGNCCARFVFELYLTFIDVAFTDLYLSGVNRKKMLLVCRFTW